MAEDSQYGYATSILTSKSPQQAGLIIPNSLTSSTNLIQTSLTNWFQQYYSNLRSHNAELKNLYNFGSSLFAPHATSATSPEFSSFVDNWKLLLSQLQTEIVQNETKLAGFKLEIIGPLRNLFEDDIRFSELVINCKELQEISHDIQKQKPNSEYQWNVKAPQILANFENFKKQEKQVLFNSVLNYFQLGNTAMANTLKSSETSVNTLLSLFNIDTEMKQYLDFLMKCEFKAVTNQYGFQPNQEEGEDSVTDLKKAPAPPKHKRYSGFGTSHSSSNNHHHNELSNGKPSKLKSKVGSIFGRKKNRHSKHSDMNTDLETISSSNSKNMLRNDGRKNSVATTTGTSPLPPIPGASHSTSAGAGLSDGADRSSGAERADRISDANASAGTGSGTIMGAAGAVGAVVGAVVGAAGAAADSIGGSERSSHFGPPPSSASTNDRPLPSIEKQGETMQEPLIPKPAIQQPVVPEEEPNLVRYESQSSDEVSREPKNGTQMNKPLPIPVDKLKKYSFEVGDEAKPLQTSPKVIQHPYNFHNSRSDIFGDDHQIFDSQKPSSTFNDRELPEPTIEVPMVSKSSQDVTGPSPLLQAPLQNNNANPNSSVSAPKPPPARKVAHNPANSQQFSEPAESIHFEPAKSEVMPGSFAVEEEPKEAEESRDKYESSIPKASIVGTGTGGAAPGAGGSILGSSNNHFSPGVTKLTSQNTGNTLLSNHVNEFKHGGNGTKGLNISIAEMLNVSVNDDVLTTGQVLGEIVFNYEGETDEDHHQQPLEIILKKEAFDKVMINDLILVETNSSNLYEINPQDILSRTIGGVKYVNEIPEGQLPVTINHVWKFEEKQASLILDLKVQKPLFNVFVYAMVAPNVRTTQCLSRPSGTFSDVKNRILWRFDELKLDQRLLARFMTSGLAKEHEAGIQLRFQIPGFAYNDGKIEALDKSNTHIVKNVASGSYSAHST